MRPGGPSDGPAALLRARRSAVLDQLGLVGGRLCRSLSDVTDQWFSDLFTAVVGGVPRLALAAVGGYGRRELAPGSDLDVVLICGDRNPPGDAAERLWYPVWDTGLKLGHSMGSVRQLLAVAADDLDSATALLDLRPLAGDGALVAELAEKAGEQWRKRSGRWLVELDRRVEQRHAAAGEVAFLLEPDVKLGRGGLRDVHALGWASVAQRVLLEGDDAALASAYEVLLAARVELHRLTGKPDDQLLLERQDEVAARLGDADADVLMGRVSAAARTVAWTSDETWHRIRSSLGGPAGRRLRADQPLGPGLLLREGAVHLAADADPVGDDSLVLRAAAAAAQAGVGIDRRTLDRLAAEAPVLDHEWSGVARQALVDLLAAGHDALPVIESLDQRGLVERVLPEWAPVRSRPQRNAYHRFTVDRHLCETAANAAALVGRVRRPDLLLVGAWLHDLGKGYPHGFGTAGNAPVDHTTAGIDLMTCVAARMGFGADDVSVLADMVRHHLLLPDAATRRDLSDDDTIDGVATAVGSMVTLELLAALTEADSLATGPSAWSPWKAELLGELVDRVAHVLTGGQASDVTAGDFLPAELRAQMAAGQEVVRAEGFHLTVIVSDRPGTFSRVAGVLALNGLAVLAADADSDDRGMAASVFRVQPQFGESVDWDKVTEHLRLALAGGLALEARLAERSRTYRRADGPGHGGRVTTVGLPSVRVDNRASGTATVVEVHAVDAVGVLYRITRALADLDLDIRHAKVQTLGHEVVDTFYVRDSAGAKLVDARRLAELERAVLHQLSRG